MCDKPEINVEVPPSYICTLKAKPVSNEKMNEELSNMPENIKKKSESLGTSVRSEMFRIEGDFNIDEEFKVMVTFNGDEWNQYLDFFAVVKYDKIWFEIPAEQKDNQVVFKTKKMKYFFIMCSPKTATMQLNSESDTIYQHESDPKIMVEFQKGSVEQTTPIAITVLPVIRKHLERLKNDFENPIIEDMSPMLIVSQPGKTDFNKPVRCTLPFKPSALSENCKILMVRLDHDDQAVVSEVETNDNDNGTYSCEVKSINICGIVQTTQSISDDRSIMLKIRDEVLYAVGEAKRCMLQTFLHKKERLIRTEIVEITKKSKVQEKMQKEGFIRVGENSKVITLRNGQRIRADLTGRIRKLQTLRHFGSFLVFQPYLDTMFMEFGFEIKNEMGTSPHGEINYSSDNYDKKVLDTLHFDPSKPFSARPISALQNQQLVKQNRPHHIVDVRDQTADKSRGRQALSRQVSNLGYYENDPQNTNSLRIVPESDVIHQQNDDGHLYELSWNGFPRVNAFRQHLINLYTRYEKSMTRYSDLINEQPIYHLELEQQINSLNTGPKILLLGEMFERTVKALVRNEKQLANNYRDKRISISNSMELTEACTSFPTIVVLSARLENEDDFTKCTQLLDQDINKLVHHSESKTILAILYAIKVSPSIQENSEQLQYFRWNFNERLKLISLQEVTMTNLRHEECIVFWCNDELSKTISDHLELHVVSCLRSLEDKLKKNLHHIIPSSCPYNRTKFMDMIEEDLINLISKDGGIISKSESKFKRKVETLSTDTTKDFFFYAQINAAQMRIENLSSSFGIQAEFIAEILSKINFQQGCQRLIKDSTVQKLLSILSSLRDPEEKEVFLKERKSYVSLFIKDISVAIEDAVTRIEGIEKSLSIHERLHFETVSLLRRTIAKEDVDHPMPDIKVPAGIQLINGVKGFGIIYNKLHIHIQQLDEDGDKKVRNEIHQLLQNYKYPYKIGVMICDPKPLYSHYVGQKIVALCSINGIKPMFGSVGAFMKDHYGDMYILTALHVVGIADDASDVRLVKKCDRNDDDYTRIGSEIYKPKNMDTLDIAAVKVINDHAVTCDVQFQKPDGTTGPYDIFHGSLEDINGRNVYKRGASTGLTSGLIASTNYTLMDMTPESHIWIVPEDEQQGSTEFAKEGDSGASVFAVEEDDLGTVNVIAMVRAGKIKIMGDNGRNYNAVLAFSMHEGIKALNLELRPCEY